MTTSSGFGDTSEYINEEFVNFINSITFRDKFGLFYVNFTSPFKERIPKKSVDFMKTVIQKRFVDADMDLKPDSNVKDNSVI